MATRLQLLGLIAVGLAAIAALAIFGFASSGSTHEHAPELPHEHIGGAPATLSTLLASAHGRPSVVVFWASWCEPCQREAPAFERFAHSAAGAGRIVGVDWSDALPGAKSFIARYGWTFPNLRDSEGTVGDEYGISGLPTTFVLNAGGRVAATLRGPQTDTSLARALAAVEARRPSGSAS
jgi:cytochrome c biogenesis protein CcmG/thiol:disulfide interchange protein DsbE